MVVGALRLGDDVPQAWGEDMLTFTLISECLPAFVFPLHWTDWLLQFMLIVYTKFYYTFYGWVLLYSS